MKSGQLKFSGRSVSSKGNTIEFAYPVLDAFELLDKIIVLFEPDARRGKPGQFHNLVAVTHNGEDIWKAALPTTMSFDTYYRISSTNPLTADSLTSFACTIDEANGRILNKVFFK
jgi:hypothetical protein